jgi:hypothetical protein
MTLKIKFNRGQAKMLGLMTEAAVPESDSLKEMVLACGLLGEDDYEESVLAALVKAYVAVRNEELYEECGAEDVLETISDGDDYTCEKVWLKYAKEGFLCGLPVDEAKRLRKEEKDSPGTLNECITCYHYSSDIDWPTELLAELAFARGYRDYRELVQMHKYMEGMSKAEIVRVTPE